MNLSPGQNLLVKSRDSSVQYGTQISVNGGRRVSCTNLELRTRTFNPGFSTSCSRTIDKPELDQHQSTYNNDSVDQIIMKRQQLHSTTGQGR